MAHDTAPLIFTVKFGALHPANTAAVEAVKVIPPGQVRVEIKRTRANEARRRFFFTMLDVAAKALTDRTGFAFDQETLHDELKRRLGLGQTFTTPSGATIFKPFSTSNRAMTEPERARWTDRCANILSHWLECPIADLMDEVRRQSGEDITP